MASKKRKVDFTGVEKEIRGGGGRAAHVPPGDYLLKIVKGEWREPEDDSKADYISWRFSILKPEKYKGKTVYDITSMAKGSLWNLRNLIWAATGKNVAGKALNFDPEMIEGKVVGATVDDDEYKKKIRSRPVDYRPKDKWKSAGDDDDEEDEDDEEEEVEEEEEEEDEELEDVDLDDL